MASHARANDAVEYPPPSALIVSIPGLRRARSMPLDLHLRIHRLGGVLDSSGSVGVVHALQLGGLAVLLRYYSSVLLPQIPKYLEEGILTFHLANLSSVSPRRSAMMRLSSFRLRRMVRAAMAR